MTTSGSVKYLFDKFKVNLANVELTVDQKLWFVQEINSGRNTANLLGIRFNISRMLINKWVYRVKMKGGLQNSTGRPRSVLRAYLPNIRREVRYGALNHRAEHVQKVIKKFHKLEAAKFGKVAESQVKPLSVRSTKRLLLECNIASGGAEEMKLF